jgi:Tfp pilus assembly protein PilO
MRANERMIIVGVAIVGLAIAFYLLAVAPKRDEASKLKVQINDLNASIAAAEQQASYGEQARQDFPKYYGRMVVLGKAVPAQSDTASLLVQLNTLADQSKLDLRAIALNQGGSGSATSSTTPSTASSPTAAATTAASTAGTTSSAGSTTPTTGSTPPAGGSSAPSTPATASPAPATEATAATLPIGSTVGPAGLPTLPYSLTLRGGYFDLAGFVGKIDELVKPVAGYDQLSPDGRLLTINGFNLQLTGSGTSSPQLKAGFVVTAYSTGDQGLTLGATPSAPAPTTPGETQAQPASAVVPK